jgi:hypothetical protein
MRRRASRPLLLGMAVAALTAAGPSIRGIVAAADGGMKCDGDTECLTVNATGTYVDSIVMAVSVPGGTVGSSYRQWCGGVETTSTDGRRFADHLCARTGKPSYTQVPVKASVPGGTTFCMSVTSTDTGSNYTPAGHPCVTVT